MVYGAPHTGGSGPPAGHRRRPGRPLAVTSPYTVGGGGPSLRAIARSAADTARSVKQGHSGSRLRLAEEMS